MATKGYSPEEIIGKLRSTEVWLAVGVSVAEVVRRLGVQRFTYYFYGHPIIAVGA